MAAATAADRVTCLEGTPREVAQTLREMGLVPALWAQQPQKQAGEGSGAAQWYDMVAGDDDESLDVEPCPCTPARRSGQEAHDPVGEDKTDREKDFQQDYAGDHEKDPERGVLKEYGKDRENGHQKDHEKGREVKRQQEAEEKARRRRRGRRRTATRARLRAVMARYCLRCQNSPVSWTGGPAWTIPPGAARAPLGHRAPTTSWLRLRPPWCQSLCRMRFPGTGQMRIWGGRAWREKQMGR
uniref:Uncharacterized protein n=1 Tax=Alexandrium monilatum TaxID=311494 RepID=A0A7S4PVS0_9DINO|mmetsp:Transcript_91187/g.288957  ORF Transcript_91187/g.288957 Transcript_91187/m.288957 type:complete len:241 (+) Transcript_91187:220-942(+)